MNISRDRYLHQLIAKKWNGKIKVITGLRRSGKSYLLNNLFVEHLRRVRGQVIEPSITNI